MINHGWASRSIRLITYGIYSLNYLRNIHEKYVNYVQCPSQLLKFQLYSCVNVCLFISYNYYIFESFVRESLQFLSVSLQSQWIFCSLLTGLIENCNRLTWSIIKHLELWRRKKWSTDINIVNLSFCLFYFSIKSKSLQIKYN